MKFSSIMSSLIITKGIISLIDFKNQFTLHQVCPYDPLLHARITSQITWCHFEKIYILSKVVIRTFRDYRITFKIICHLNGIYCTILLSSTTDQTFMTFYVHSHKYAYRKVQCFSALRFRHPLRNRKSWNRKKTVYTLNYNLFALWVYRTMWCCTVEYCWMC